MLTRGTGRGWFTKVRLHRDDIGTILDALSDMRDSSGGEATELEMQLQELVRKCDAQWAEAKGLRGEGI